MRAGQTSVRGGVQDLLCPFTSLYITQGANEGSHKGIEAIDVRGDKSGIKAPYYAPCDLKVVRILHDTATVMWQTLKPVRLANGKVSHITIVTAHDNTINFRVGYVIKQGVQMGNMGDKGIGSGVHAHIEQGYGHQTSLPSTSGTFTLKGKTYAIYGLRNQIAFEDAYFVDNTKILRGVAKWKNLKDVQVSEYNLKPSGSFLFENDVPVRIRNGKDGLGGKDTGVFYEKGQKLNHYDGTYEKDGYIWVTYMAKSGNRRSVAVGKNGKLWGKNV